MFNPPSLAAAQNDLQLKILQRGGALGDAQIGWPSRLPLRSDRRHVEKRLGWSQSRISNIAGRKGATSETAAEFVRLHRTSLGKSWPAGTSLLSARESTRTSACHSSIVGFPNATIITVRGRQPLDGLRPASQTTPPSPIHEGARCGK